MSKKKRNNYGKPRIVHKKKGPSPVKPQEPDGIFSSFAVFIWIAVFALLICLIVYVVKTQNDTTDEEATTETYPIETEYVIEDTSEVIENTVEEETEAPESLEETTEYNKELANPKNTKMFSGAEFAKELNNLAKDKSVVVDFCHSDDIPENSIDISEDGNNSISMWLDNETVYVACDNNSKIMFNESCWAMFNAEDVEIIGINFNDAIDTKNVEDMSFMFGNCSSLISLDVSGFDTSNVKTFGGMFQGCRNLKELDLSGFNTDNVTIMHTMFSQCESIEKINLSSFNTKNVTTMGDMFNGCVNLKELDVSHFNTTEVVDMSGMFSDCSSLEILNLANFVAPKLEDTSYMFWGCSNLRGLDISGLSICNLEKERSMFMLSNMLKFDIAFAKTQEDADILNEMLGDTTTSKLFTVK